MTPQEQLLQQHKTYRVREESKRIEDYNEALTVYKDSFINTMLEYTHAMNPEWRKQYHVHLNNMLYTTDVFCAFLASYYAKTGIPNAPPIITTPTA